MRRAALLALVSSAVAASAATALPPTITPIITGPPGDNGWYTGDVIVNWSISPPGYLVELGCQATPINADTTGTTVPCQASIGSESASSNVVIRRDATPPTASARPDRAPDGAGFYNHAVTATWIGADGTSGMASCAPPAPYAGPDGIGLPLVGTCRDRAGNVSAPVPFTFSYDATPPALSNVRATAGNRRVALGWRSAGATRIVVARNGDVVYDGTGSTFTDRAVKNRKRYTYAVEAVDAAGNATTRTIGATPQTAASRDRLLAPRIGAQVTKPPLLRWRAVGKASYYNVQLYQGKHKVLSAWPSKPHYLLRHVWQYGGRRYVLAHGAYRWYLWAGYGERATRRYGHLLGQRSFSVR